MKKCLFLACTQFQLLCALQIKHTLLSEVPCDMILLNTEANLDGIRKIFNKVVWCRWNEAPLPKDAIRCFFDPLFALEHFYLDSMDLDFDNYTDLFYYGPCWVYYFIYKYYLISGHDYNGHYYPEGDAAYLGILDNPPAKWYGNIVVAKIIKTIDYYYYGYGKENLKKAKDIYLFSPHYLLRDPILPVVEIPLFSIDDKNFISIINEVFNYRHINLSGKVIYIDGCWDGSREDFYDVKHADSVLIKLGDFFGKDCFWLKRHHSATMNMYSEQLKQHISIFEENFPWEIAFINGDVKNCCILGWESSAITNPFKYGLCDVPVYLLTDVFQLKFSLERRFELKLLKEKNVKKVKDEFELFNELYEIKEYLEGV